MKKQLIGSALLLCSLWVQADQAPSTDSEINIHFMDLKVMDGSELYSNGRMEKPIRITYRASSDVAAAHPIVLTPEQIKSHIHLSSTYQIDDIKSSEGIGVNLDKQGDWESILPFNFESSKTDAPEDDKEFHRFVLWVSYQKPDINAINDIDLCVYADGVGNKGGIYTANCLSDDPQPRHDIDRKLLMSRKFYKDNDFEMGNKVSVTDCSGGDCKAYVDFEPRTEWFGFDHIYVDYFTLSPINPHVSFRKIKRENTKNSQFVKVKSDTLALLAMVGDGNRDDDLEQWNINLMQSKNGYPIEINFKPENSINYDYAAVEIGEDNDPNYTLDYLFFAPGETDTMNGLTLAHTDVVVWAWLGQFENLFEGDEKTHIELFDNYGNVIELNIEFTDTYLQIKSIKIDNIFN